MPCGSCTACCTSSQFVLVGPDEDDALAHVPRELLVPAPGMPDGHLVLGYDERGHCPMLHDGACSIYEHRPRACRAYDCRVLAAAGVVPDDDRHVGIADRVRRWAFDLTAPGDQEALDAVRAATRFLAERALELPAGAVPRQATQLAFVAVLVHHLFVDGEAEPALDAVAALLAPPLAPPLKAPR